MKHIFTIIITACALLVQSIASAEGITYKPSQEAISLTASAPTFSLTTELTSTFAKRDFAAASTVTPLPSSTFAPLPASTFAPLPAASKGANKGWWQEKSDYTTKFRPTQLIVPAALFTVGALGISENAPLHKLDIKIRDMAVGLEGNRRVHLDDYLQYLPTAMYLGLSAFPKKSKHTFPEKLCVATVALISEAALVNGIKYSVHKPRPHNAEHNSFPSGHTATAFTGAELVRTEYGWGWGIPAYIMATGVGCLRIYNDRHWITDTLGGAAIGIISARIGYWLLPLSRKLFNLKSSTALAVAPVYYSEQRAAGASYAICF